MTFKPTSETLLSIFIVLLISYLYISCKKNTTPSLFVLNTYLYVVLSISLLWLIILQLNKMNIKLTSLQLFLIFIVGILSIVGIRSFSEVALQDSKGVRSFSKNNKITSHFLWILFIVSISFMTLPIYNNSDKGKTAMITTIILFLLLSIYSYNTTTNFISWGKYLIFGLLALIIFQISTIVFGFSASSWRSNIFNYIVIALFSGFILYDTQLLKIRSNTITSPNYPSESLSIFLDIVNMFSSVSNLH